MPRFLTLWLSASIFTIYLSSHTICLSPQKKRTAISICARIRTSISSLSVGNDCNSLRKNDKYLGANNMLSLTSGLFRMLTPLCPTYLWFPYQSATNIVNKSRIGRRTWSSFTTCVTVLTLVLMYVSSVHASDQHQNKYKYKCTGTREPSLKFWYMMQQAHTSLEIPLEAPLLNFVHVLPSY